MVDILLDPSYPWAFALIPVYTGTIAPADAHHSNGKKKKISNFLIDMIIIVYVTGI